MAAELARAGYDLAPVGQLLERLATREIGGEGPVEAALQQTLSTLASLGVSARFDPTLVQGIGLLHGADLRDFPSGRPVLTRWWWPL